MSKKLIAEALGTFILVFFGCGAAAIAGSLIGFTGIAIAFGVSIVAAAYGFGAISGAHLNPAVSLGFVTAGRMSVGEFIGYSIAQIIGAIVAAGCLYIILGGQGNGQVPIGTLGANGWGPGYLGEYTLGAALVFEVVATFVFVSVILGATGPGSSAGFAGLAIGLTLTGIHLVGINVTGVSVNPARSIGPAVFVGGQAIANLWVFIVAPLVGGAIAGAVYAAGLTRAED